MSLIPCAQIDLGGGVMLPQLGYGTWQVPPADTRELVAAALAAGYRHIDTAAIYGNERGVGEALRESGIAREQVFITTKLWNDAHGRESARAALECSLGKLGLDHVDLYLIHWPLPSVDRYVETWEALIELREAGLATAIGVSNFLEEHLRRIVAETSVVPAVNQIELHPYLAQGSLRAVHEELGIATESWSPLAQGEVLADPAIAAIAAAHAVTPAQVVVRWHLQQGLTVIPRSIRADRIASNADVFGFSLDPDELARICALDAGRRVGPDPATFAFV